MLFSAQQYVLNELSKKVNKKNIAIHVDLVPSRLHKVTSQTNICRMCTVQRQLRP